MQFSPFGNNWRSRDNFSYRGPRVEVDGQVFDPDNALLRWAPPTLVSAVTLSTGSSFYQSAVQADNQDVIVQLPGSIRNNNSDVEIRGGRNIVIIGGHMRGRLTIKDFTGSVYIEGLRADLSGAPNKDALNIYGKSGTPDVTIQNCRITGLQGTNAGVHADVFQQTSGYIGTLRIDKLTFDSNYQGIFIRPEFSISRAIISRANGSFNALGTPEANTYLYWFRSLTTDAAAPVADLYPIDLKEVYSANNSTNTSQAAAFPNPGAASRGEPSTAAYAGSVDGSGNMSWPAGSGITGMVKKGAPAGGDFVSAASVGVGYVAATQFQGA